jgi:LacI family transcriptional regulator
MDPCPTRRNKRQPSASSPAESGAVTLEMVAQASGVSPSTVSRILNNTAKVSAEKRRAVDAAIKRLGFRPNPVARGLAGGRTLSIGVLTQFISSPFYGEALHGIEDHLVGEGYIPIFVSGHWNEREERKALDALMSRRVDGVIVLAGKLSNAALRKISDALPMVVVGRAVRGPQLCSLEFDNHAGGRMATQHLVDAGHRDIAFISGDPTHDDAIARQRGYLEALTQAGIAADEALIVPGQLTEESGLAAVDLLLARRRPFTALFAANDQMATGAALGLYRRRIRVPDQVSLVGFDDLAIARFALPPLTTVRQPVYEMGRQAALAVLGLLRGEHPRVDLPPPELVVRESTRPVRD